MKLHFDFSTPLRWLGPDWVACSEVFADTVSASGKSGGVLLLARVENEGVEVVFDWPGEIRNRTLKVFDLPRQTAIAVGDQLGLDTFQDRVREARERFSA